MKRLFDILLSLIGLLLAAPVFVVVAALVVVDSPGPVFFVQKRLGRGKATFGMVKFRKFPHASAGGPGVTMARDARMTRVGRFLERTKLDELPQLWNILRGEMSFVGPRPESLVFADMYEDERWARLLDYTPGIFGPNQVAMRNESALYPPDRDPEEFYREVLFPEKGERDLAYFSRATLLSDLGWIIRGLWVSVAGAVDWKGVFKLHGRILPLDALCTLVAWHVATLLRFGGLPPRGDVDAHLFGLAFFPIWIVAFSLLFGGYRTPPRFFDLGAMLRYAGLLFVGLCGGAFFFVGLWFRDASFYLFPIFYMIQTVLLGSVRAGFRVAWERRQREAGHDGEAVRILIYGAGRAGRALGDWVRYRLAGCEVVGFVDDAPAMLGRQVGGMDVLGNEKDIPSLKQTRGVNEVWLTFVPDERKQARLDAMGRDLGLHFIPLLEMEPFSRFAAANRIDSPES